MIKRAAIFVLITKVESVVFMNKHMSADFQLNGINCKIEQHTQQPHPYYPSIHLRIKAAVSAASWVESAFFLKITFSAKR